mmetsp:Transcript_93818/g.223047  ORF Transcript_93818/g.223047 Transcript_93818/m.223047 type:complete len:252 (-) Transcript_93818:171-926(-)
MSFSSWKILNFNKRTMRPKRASFSIFRELRAPVSFSSPLAAADKFKDRSTIASTTQMTSNQLQYQSAPHIYSIKPKTRIFTTISPTKNKVKAISKATQTPWSGEMSWLNPATTALINMTMDGTTSSISRKVASSSVSSSESLVLNEFRKKLLRRDALDFKDFMWSVIFGGLEAGGRGVSGSDGALSPLQLAESSFVSPLAPSPGGSMGSPSKICGLSFSLSHKAPGSCTVLSWRFRVDTVAIGGNGGMEPL